MKGVQNYKMKILRNLTSLALLASLAAITPVNAEIIGDKTGTVYNTDIVAYINNYAIASYAANGTSVIVAEELRYFGFDVEWNETERSLSITRNTETQPDEMNVLKQETPGSEFSDILYTDIAVYANGVRIPSYAINGYTMIPMESLTMFGECYWIPEQRALKLWVDGLNIRPTMQPVAFGRAIKSPDADLASTLPDQQRYELNIFLSNFSELWFPAYDESAPDNNALIFFGCLHNSRNHTDGAIAISDEEAQKYVNLDYYDIHACYKVNKNTVENTVARYFGKTVNHGSAKTKDMNGFDWSQGYNNGYYYFDSGEEGDFTIDVAVVDSMFENNDGTYTVTFKSYIYGDIDLLPEIYYSTPASVAGKEAYATGTAVVRPYSYNGRNTYQLVSYSASRTY